MAGADPAAHAPGPTGNLPRDPASAEANAATIDHLRTLLADHAAGRVRSDLWDEGGPDRGDRRDLPDRSAADAPRAAARGGSAPADSGAAGSAGPAGSADPADPAAPGDPAGPTGSGGAAPVPGAADEGRADAPSHGGGRRADGAGGEAQPATGLFADPDDPYERGREIALRQLSFSARSRHQLASAMSERGIPEAVVGEILDRFEKVGLVDDAEYAAMLVRTRYRERGLARPALAEELRRKGITGPVADAALDQVGADDERAAALDLVERRLRSMGPVEPAKRRRRLCSMLARRGYATGVAVSVVDEALAAQG